MAINRGKPRGGKRRVSEFVAGLVKEETMTETLLRVKAFAIKGCVCTCQGKTSIAVVRVCKWKGGGTSDLKHAGIGTWTS